MGYIRFRLWVMTLRKRIISFSRWSRFFERFPLTMRFHEVIKGSFAELNALFWVSRFDYITNRSRVVPLARSFSREEKMNPCERQSPRRIPTVFSNLLSYWSPSHHNSSFNWVHVYPFVAGHQWWPPWPFSVELWWRSPMVPPWWRTSPREGVHSLTIIKGGMLRQLMMDPNPHRNVQQLLKGRHRRWFCVDLLRFSTESFFIITFI